MKKPYESNIKTGEFTIYDYNTGRDWSNFLWNNIGYVSNITHSGTIFSRYVNENNVQIVLDVPKANLIYVRDEKTKSYFNPGVYPTAKKVSNYRCTHGQDFSRVASEYEGIDASVEYRLEPNDKREVWKVDIKNTSNETKEISVFGMMAFDMNGYDQNIYYSSITTSETLFLKEANGMYCRMQNPYSPFKDDAGFILSSEPVHAYEGNLDAFLGTMGTHTKPYILEEGMDLSNSLATVKGRIGCLQNKIMLKPLETKTIYYVLGFTFGAEELLLNHNQYIRSAKSLFTSKEASIGYDLTTKSPDDRINLIMNNWVQKQVDFCSIGKKAVRDNSQLAVGILNYDPKKSKKVILECLRHQYKDGHAILTYYPYLDHTVYSDPAFWLVWAVCEYIKETGEFEFLDEVVPYIDGESDSIYAHIKQAVKWYLDPKNFGPNGFPKIYHADWNDALNIPDDQAESVFIAFNIVYMLNEVIKLAHKMNDHEYANSLVEDKAHMKRLINDKAFNGDYYVRAFSKFGTVGDKTDINGGQIYVNPQSWAILSETVTSDKMDKVISSIDKMETIYGLPLCSPAYKKYDPHVGRMSGMLPGVYENGGIYNHAGCFKVMADCKMKRKENALNTLLKIIPDGQHNPSSITKTEPYVFTNCYLKHPSVDMQVGFSWQTGTSAWGLRCYYEGILGLIRTYEGLMVDPCLPKAWKTVKATRKYRDHLLDITYQNENADKVTIFVDGKEISGQVIPQFTDQKTHHILVKC